MNKTNWNTMKRLADAIRILTIDAIEKANSGHPGMPMGMADVATVLYNQYLRFNPTDPLWPDRDRFVLSAGHGSMLIYSLAYLTGYEVSLDDLKNFRQYQSKTAGHPEWGVCPGVETTTGPLGQGIANAVGMALTERILNARFGNDLINHKTYALVGDGCLMEGISQEAISLAGHLGLSNLIALFDSNGISIDGKTSLTTSEDHRQRFTANGWKVLEADGHDYPSIDQCLTEAQKSDKPTLIIFKTIIGYGSPNKQGSEKVHGSPLGKEESQATKKNLGYKGEPFTVDEETLKLWRKIGKKGEILHREWQERLEKSSHQTIFQATMRRDIPSTLSPALEALKKKFISEKTPLATRQSSQKCLEVMVPLLPSLIGGSADLTASNLTWIQGHQTIQASNYQGNYLHYGVREHAMVAIINGMCLHGGVIPYGSTFLVFTDYARPALRLSALMGIPALMVMTHDSIGLGEDGPTHQPIEHLSTLRAIPHLRVYRPCDTIETAECWELMIRDTKHPSILSLCRQSLPLLRTEVGHLSEKSGRGAYVIWRNSEKQNLIEKPLENLKKDMVIAASGSETSLAVEIGKALSASKPNRISVVSIPCMELLKEQGKDYLEKLFPQSARIIAIEAGIQMSWDWLLKSEDIFFGVEDFGISAPYKEVYHHFGLTCEKIIKKINENIFKDNH